MSILVRVCIFVNKWWQCDTFTTCFFMNSRLHSKEISHWINTMERSCLGRNCSHNYIAPLQTFDNVIPRTIKLTSDSEYNMVSEKRSSDSSSNTFRAVHQPNRLYIKTRFDEMTSTFSRSDIIRLFLRGCVKSIVTTKSWNESLKIEG